MNYLDFALLFISGMVGGVLNATVGGGWFIVFPSLICSGRQPVSGDAMTIATLWSGHLASIRSDSNRIAISRKDKNSLCVISLMGGILGAFLLVIFSHQTFEFIGPYFLLFSWIMFTFDKNILSYFDSKEKKTFEYSHSKLVPLFLLNVYASYFGAGVGMMFTVLFGFYGFKEDKLINAIKDFMIAINNGIAVLIFIFSGLIHWPFAVALILGSAIGGYYGVKISSKINMIAVKRIMIIIGALVTLYFLNIIDLDSII